MPLHALLKAHLLIGLHGILLWRVMNTPGKACKMEEAHTILEEEGFESNIQAFDLVGFIQ